MTATSRLAHLLRRPLARAAASACAATRVALPAFPPAFAHGAASSRGLAAFALAPTATAATAATAATVTTAGAAAALFAARGISTSAPAALAAKRPPRDKPASTDLQQSEERFDEITDKWIPEKPVSAAEAGGYSLVIAAGLAVALGAMWYSFKELLFEPKEQSVFAAALAKVETDPRVVVRVGTPMTSYGKEGRSRSARRQLAHTTHVDGFGREHVRVQGAVRGPQGKGTVHADAYKGDGGGWEFAYLVVDAGRDRVVVVQPQAGPSIMRQAAE